MDGKKLHSTSEAQKRDLSVGTSGLSWGRMDRDLNYSGTPLLWTPWGPGEVPCTERCPHFRNPSIVDTLGTW